MRSAGWKRRRAQVLAAFICGGLLGCSGGEEMELPIVQDMAGTSAAAGVGAGAAAAGTTAPTAGTLAPTAGMAGATAAAGVGTPAGTGAAGTAEMPQAGMGSTPTELEPSADPIPEECQGFPLEGLMESPGGDILPNKCAPFHATWNNPYAVLCVHAWPWYDTGFVGDEYCILPPPADKGIQVGFHPMEGVYWDNMLAQDVSGYQVTQSSHPAWVLPKGGEETRNYIAPADNPEAKTYYRTYFRMRTGSHHNIITLHAANPSYEWLASFGDALPGLFDIARPIRGVLGGQQRPDDNTPVTYDKPPEDEGLYLNWPEQPSVLYNLHHFNTTDGDVLKEGWVNVWWEDDTRTAVSWYMGLSFEQVGSLRMSPGEVEDYHYVWDIAWPVRLIRVFGHRHVWTTNFSTWIERASGELEVIYQSFDWWDMPTYRYDSVVTNPMPNREIYADGAASGIIELKAGDKMHFNCHMEFTDERAAAEDAPTPNEVGTLVFANEAYTGEMCIQFGNVAGGLIGPPARSMDPVPDFAK